MRFILGRGCVCPLKVFFDNSGLQSRAVLQAHYDYGKNEKGLKNNVAVQQLLVVDGSMVDISCSDTPEETTPLLRHNWSIQLAEKLARLHGRNYLFQDFHSRNLAVGSTNVLNSNGNAKLNINVD